MCIASAQSGGAKNRTFSIFVSSAMPFGTMRRFKHADLFIVFRMHTYVCGGVLSHTQMFMWLMNRFNILLTLKCFFLAIFHFFINSLCADHVFNQL